jgi:hypothetical protein
LNLPKEKLVHIFDFDETLCKTNAKIKIKDLEQNMSFDMHPTDYPEWREEKWVERYPKRFSMDFSDFQGYPVYGVPIKGTIRLLKVLLTSDEDLCVVVTGRDELSGPRAWLMNNGVDVNKMILMCSGDPNKRMCYESIINTLQPNKIILYEDSQIYIDQCSEVCSKYEINFEWNLIEAENLL